MARAADSVGPLVLDALWLSTLQRIVGRAAHEVKGALNGVSVNLEVVRSRSEKPDAPAQAVTTFANAAVDQLDALIALTEAVLALARALREPVELGLLIERFGALLVPAARADGRRLVLDDSLHELGVTSAKANAVRLAIGGCLLAAIEQSMTVRCTAGSTATVSESSIRIDGSDGDALVVDAELVAAAAGAGVQIVAEASALFISFPR
ncbi:MAG: hypothetical protein ABI205_06525 [Gemmatimonadaceae bacterium]